VVETVTVSEGGISRQLSRQVPPPTFVNTQGADICASSGAFICVSAFKMAVAGRARKRRAGSPDEHEKRISRRRAVRNAAEFVAHTQNVPAMNRCIAGHS